MGSERAAKQAKLRMLRRKKQPNDESEGNASSTTKHEHADILNLQQLVGNRGVQRLMDGASPIQRAPLTEEQRAQNLTSARYAGDQALEDAYDNVRPLSTGRSGDYVAKVQQGMIDDGFAMPITTQSTGSPDGIFGSETRATVRAFQEKHSLGIDGVVGRQTMGKLDELAGGGGRGGGGGDPEVEATEEALGAHVVKDMNELNDGSRATPTSGVWYAENYRAAHNADPANYPWNEDMWDGKANPAYFERLSFMKWRLKPGVSASEAIKDWLHGLTIAECASALVAIEYDTLRAALGDTKFDQIFGSRDVEIPEADRMLISQSANAHPLGSYMKQTQGAAGGDPGTIGNRPAQLGEWYYFYNHPKYLLKHPNGAWQGENAVFMGTNSAGQQLWSGMGASNVTETEMYDQMVEAYNGGRDDRDYEGIYNYHMHPKPEVTDPNPNYQTIYETHKDRVDPRYREDSGEFEDRITVDKILNDPAYTIGDTERKGGFVLNAGQELDIEKIKREQEERDR